MRLGLVASLASGFLSGATAGDAGGPRWVEARTAHFVVYSDAGDKEAVQVARQFERLRAALGELLPKARLDPGVPILIFAARNESSLKHLLPAFWETKGSVQPVGVFTRGTRRYYIVMRTDVDMPRERGDNPYHVLYHEYMHLVLDLNVESVPVWLNEGLAELFGATLITKDEIELRRPVWSHMQFLRSETLLPISALFKIDHSSPEYNERERAGVFYAQAWALVHYLINDEKASVDNRIGRFFKLRQARVAEPEAVAQAFGDPSALDEGLKTYIQRNRLGFYRGKAVSRALEESPRVRELSAAESAAARGLLQVHGKRPVEARALLEEAIRLDPELPDAREGIGLLAWREGKEDEARRWLGEAVRLPSASAVAHYSHALLSIRQPESVERMAEAQASLERAVALDPSFAEALVMLAQVSTNRGADVDQILALMRRAIELEPAVFDYRLTVARLLLSCGNIEAARDQAAMLLARSRSEPDRTAARSLLASLSAPAAGLARDTVALLSILARRCAWGTFPDCVELADRYRQGAGVAADPSRALPLYERACANEIFEACARAAQAYEVGEGVAQDAAQTAVFYDRGCEGGDLFSCGRLGWLLAEGQLIGKDETRSLLLSGKACDGGYAPACNTVGVVHMRRKEYAKATAPLAKSCEAGEAAACGNLALLYEQGLGVSRSVARAATLHKMACDAGLASSCERLSVVPHR
jgi:TPR repeat protein